MSLSYRLGSRSLFERPNEGSVQPKRVVFLSVEGSCTEVDYFKFVEKYRKQLGIDLLYLDFLNKYRGDDDRFAIVIDRDCGSHSLKQMTDVVEKCQKKNYLYYITNPCIEFWLLLHVSDVAQEYADHLQELLDNRKEHDRTYVSDLLHDKVGHRKHLSEKVFVEHYLPNIDLAIERARDFAPKEELLVQLGSNMGELFCLLRASQS